MVLMLKKETIQIAADLEPPSPLMTLDTQAHSTCSSETLDDLINSPLPTSLRDNVDVTALERSGCFAINNKKSGLYRIVHERNFAHVICNTTQKKFFPASKKAKPVSSIIIFNNFFLKFQ